LFTTVSLMATPIAGAARPVAAMMLSVLIVTSRQ
jgi:hypothetical protein